MNGSNRTMHRFRAWRRVAGAAGIVASLACAAPPPPAPSYQEQLSRWQGESEADLVSAWGMPKSTHVLADGGRILEYRRSDSDAGSCTTRFTLDSSGKIVRWWFSGVGCGAP